MCQEHKRFHIKTGLVVVDVPPSYLPVSFGVHYFVDWFKFTDSAVWMDVKGPKVNFKLLCWTFESSFVGNSHLHNCLHFLQFVYYTKIESTMDVVHPWLILKFEDRYRPFTVELHQGRKMWHFGYKELSKLLVTREAVYTGYTTQISKLVEAHRYQTMAQKTFFQIMISWYTNKLSQNNKTIIFNARVSSVYACKCLQMKGRRNVSKDEGVKTLLGFSI